ncbi:hypothetical protein MAPG_06336 [Magnaporthiopsis poae ATCC 64411]|uniref:Uncharacterized protein n=1 Tax=Magnaporthiopsis poae (strain ATCC 64411 / 73-15) TaxID=644358 RepID=A0A0C4E1R6_MAGP6|nr:hypothetical protein MAPG_06336 [Magnaporthiopsis poae ATCC 64411]
MECGSKQIRGAHLLLSPACDNCSGDTGVNGTEDTRGMPQDTIPRVASHPAVPQSGGQGLRHAACKAPVRGVDGCVIEPHKVESGAPSQRPIPPCLAIMSPSPVFGTAKSP